MQYADLPTHTKMLVPRVAQDAQPLQCRSHLRTGFVLLRRQPIRERAIRIAKPEVLDQLRIPQAAPFQVLQRLGVRF
jgi:hypothetical protein